MGWCGPVCLDVDQNSSHEQVRVKEHAVSKVSGYLALVEMSSDEVPSPVSHDEVYVVHWH